MKLQIDATVIYALTNGMFDLNRNLKFKDYYANYKKFLRVISVEELKEKY